MAELASPPSTGGQPFISPDLNASPVTKSGYTLTYTPGADVAGAAASCTTLGGIPVDIYAYAGDPVSLNSSGTRYFGTNEQQTIYQHATTSITFGAAPARAVAPAAAAPLK
jgi:hypothetical protein